MDINVNSSKKINLDYNTLLILYKHYKAYVLPFGVILASIFVFIFVLIPGIQQYLNSQEQLKIETEKLSVLKNNYNFLASVDDAKADNDLKTLSLALPTIKDFAGVLNAISVASSKTGVSIGEFEFSVGDLEKSSEGDIANPSIKINVSVGGKPSAIVGFIKELYKTVPLSDVLSIKSTGDLATLGLIFYYKPFPPQNISDDTPIVPFSQQTLNLINEIPKWNNFTPQISLPLIPSLDSSSSGTFISTPSAGSNLSPF